MNTKAIKELLKEPGVEAVEIRPDGTIVVRKASAPQYVPYFWQPPTYLGGNRETVGTITISGVGETTGNIPSFTCTGVTQ